MGKDNPDDVRIAPVRDRLRQTPAFLVAEAVGQAWLEVKRGREGPGG